MTKLLQHLVSPVPYREDIGDRRALLVSTRVMIRGGRAWHRHVWAAIRRRYGVEAPCLIIEPKRIEPVPVTLTWRDREVEVVRWEGPDLPRDHVDVWLVHCDQIRTVHLSDLVLQEVRGGVLVGAA